MKKNKKNIFILLIAALIFTSCTKNVDKDKADISQASEGVTFTDDMGQTVTVNDPKSVVTMIGSFTDTWLLAGGSVAAACDDSWASLKLDLPESTVNIGKVKEPNLEMILSVEPDFIIGSINTAADVEMKATFDSLGITNAYFDVSDFESYLRMLDICTDITGRKDLYEKNGLDVAKQIEVAKKRADGSSPTVLYLRTSSSSVQAKGSEGNVCGEILKNLSCTNIADGNSLLTDNLSLEAIMKADPEYIFVTPQGTDKEAALKNIEDMFTSNPAWQSLSAVKNGKYYVLDPYLYNLKPNERWGEAYEKMADILYPAE